MTFSLANKVVWLIGASSGIGRQLALDLAKKGATVCASARTESALLELKEQGVSGLIQPFPLDVADSEAVKNVYENIKAAQGVPDVIICNAGIYEPVNGASFKSEATLNLLDINLGGVVRCIGTCLPDFISRRSGYIVGVASVVGYRGLPNSAAYGASKAAIINLLQSLRFDLKPFGIKISIVNPGFVKTRLTDKNEFPMPFRIGTEEASRNIIAGLEKQDREIHFPKRLTYIAKLFRIIPYSLYEYLLSKKVA